MISPEAKSTECQIGIKQLGSSREEGKDVDLIRYLGIDPSTKTGFVALDEQGETLKEKEIIGVGSKDPKRMITLIDDLMDHIYKDDFIAIEGFAFGAQGQGVAFQYGLGHGIRMALARRGFNYFEVPPAALKKFATGKGNTKKENMIMPIYRHWGFEHNSDNVRDAYVLAQIAKELQAKRSSEDLFNNLPAYQNEVLEAILNPKPKAKKKKKVTK